LIIREERFTGSVLSTIFEPNLSPRVKAMFSAKDRNDFSISCRVSFDVLLKSREKSAWPGIMLKAPGWI